MEEYTIIVRADTKWLMEWSNIPEHIETPGGALQLWIEIATAGTAISVQSVEKSEE